MKKLQQEEAGYDIKFIEDNKENTLSQCEGRKVSQLIPLYSKSAEEQGAEREEKKKSFEQQLITAQGKEVFEIFYSYINWALNNCPEDQYFQSNLFNILKRACWKFREDAEFKEDQRYFGFWAAYIKLTDNPVEIFALLDKDKIGVSLSMRYEEEANYYEQKKQFQLALEAYQKGLLYCTYPVGALDKSLTSFKERMSCLEEVHLNPLRIKSPQLVNDNPSTNQFDSICLPPKRKGLAIFRDPEGLYELSRESNSINLSDYTAKNIRTKQNIESKTGSNKYFIEKGSAVPDIKFNIVASSKPLTPGPKDEISFEEQRYASITTEVNIKQPVNHVSLSNLKPRKKVFHQALHKKRSFTEPIFAAKHKAPIAHTCSAETTPLARKKILSGLPCCSTSYSKNYCRDQLELLFTDDSEAAEDEELDKGILASIAGIDDKHLNTNSSECFYDLSVSLTTNGSPSFPISPSMKLLLAYPTIHTIDTLELANTLANEPIDYELCANSWTESWVDPFASDAYNSSEEL